MLEKLKRIYNFLYKKSVEKGKRLEREFLYFSYDYLIEPEERPIINDKKVPLEDIRDCYNKIDMHHPEIKKNDFVLGELYNEYIITFHCIRIDRYHDSNKNPKYNYACEYWVFKVDQLLNYNHYPVNLLRTKTKEKTIYFPKRTMGHIKYREEKGKKKLNGKRILETIKKLNKNEVEPTFNKIEEELDLEYDKIALAIFALRENNKVYWENKPNSIAEDDIVHLQK